MYVLCSVFQPWNICSGHHCHHKEGIINRPQPAVTVATEEALTMTDEANGIIRLRSSDGKVFELTESAAEISELLKDSPREEDDEVTEIDIVRVASPCLEKVVEFMKHYDEEKMKEIPTPLGGSTFNEVGSNSLSLPDHPTNKLALIRLIAF